MACFAALQVSKHLEKMQAEKENMAIEKLSALMPQMGAAVRVVALRQAVFDVDTAVGLLRRFHTENEEALKALQKVRCDGCSVTSARVHIYVLLA